MLPSSSISSIGQQPYRQTFGVYAASIVNASDPLNQGRVQLLIPQVLGTAYSNWADRVGMPWDTSNVGGVTSPTVGQTVIAAFEGGDINRPCYFPGGWNPAGNLTITNLNIPANSGNHFGVDNNGLVYLIKTVGTTLAITAQVVGDSTFRWEMDANGKMQWGPGGSGAVDTTLRRSNPSQLTTDGGFVGVSYVQTFGGFQSIQPPSTNLAFAVNALFSANSSFAFDCNGQLFWGLGGANVADTHLYRSAAGQLAADNIVKNVSGSPETWHALSLQNGWVNTGGSFVTAQYRFDTDNSVWLIGDISSGTTTSPTTIANLPAAYRPAHAQSIPLMLATGSTVAPILAPVVAADGSGNLQIWNLPNGTNRIIFNGKIRLDA